MSQKQRDSGKPEQTKSGAFNITNSIAAFYGNKSGNKTLAAMQERVFQLRVEEPDEEVVDELVVECYLLKAEMDAQSQQMEMLEDYQTALEQKAQEQATELQELRVYRSSKYE